MDYVVEEIALCRSRVRSWSCSELSRRIQMRLRRLHARSSAKRTSRFVRCLYEQVNDYYLAADLFVLASLKEGFGRVFLEALDQGLPVVAHNHPVMRFVLGDEAKFGDLSSRGTLSEIVRDTLLKPESFKDAERRRETVRQRFSWPVLAPQYRDMFVDCFEKVNPSLLL